MIIHIQVFLNVFLHTQVVIAGIAMASRFLNFKNLLKYDGPNVVKNEIFQTRCKLGQNCQHLPACHV